MKVRVFAACAILVTAVNSREAAAQKTYQFLKIADSSGAFSNISQEIAINDNGAVAFMAVLDQGGSSVFIGSGGATTLIADTMGVFAEFGAPVDINNSGRVAFTARLDAAGLRGVYSGIGGPVTTIAMADRLGDSFASPSINASGTVSFRRVLSQFPSSSADLHAVYASDGGSITTIFETSSRFSVLEPGTAINDSGTVAFQTLSGIYSGNGGPLATIASKSGPFVSFGPTTQVAVNNSGTAAFLGILDSGLIGVYTGSGGPTTAIVTSAGPFAFFGADIPINDFGDVAFHAWLDGSDAAGVYTGPDRWPTTLFVLAMRCSDRR